MQLSFAPLEGITGYRFPQCARALVRCSRPLLHTLPDAQQTYKFTSREKNDVLPETIPA